MDCNWKVNDIQQLSLTDLEALRPRKNQGEKCKPIYKAIAFPVFPALTYSFQGASEMLVLDVKWKSVRRTVRSRAVASTHANIIQLVEKSQFSVVLIKWNEQGAKILKMPQCIRIWIHHKANSDSLYTQSLGIDIQNNPANLPNTPLWLGCSFVFVW